MRKLNSTKHIVNHYELVFSDFKRLSKSAILKPSVKNIHDLRSDLKRIRVFLWILKVGTELKIKKALKENLKTWNQTLGKKRQVDVLCEDAVRFHLDPSFVIKLKKETNSQFEKNVSLKNRKKILALLNELGKKLDTLKNIHPKKVLNKTIDEFSNLPKTLPLEETKLHALRIHSKKTRYALEYLGVPTDTLKVLQSHLGRVHDLQVLEKTYGLRSESV